MALFKILSGDEFSGNTSIISDGTNFSNNLPFKEGWAYFCKDTGALYVDAYVDDVATRIPVRTHSLLNQNSVINSDEILTTSDITDLQNSMKTTATTATITSGQWSNGTYTLSIANLRCGNGSTPPMIICTNTDSAGKNVYNHIASALATPAASSASNGTIVFTLTTGFSPTANVSLIIIDFG